MSQADEWFLVVAFTIVSVMLAGLRQRFKRVEAKLDKILDRNSSADYPKSTLL